ncbi:hypothetical protein Bbelb_118650 [Branchiostoma belcheri]|nr:hypothetical protein Bbelb_118650 [Branchiostoma belcheri]
MGTKPTSLIPDRKSGCGGILTTLTGGFGTSPNYPSNYGNNENCGWLITAPVGSIIRLTFDSFNTEGGYDILTIYDGASASAALIQRLSGPQSVSPVISTSNSLFLRFTSDSSVTHQGFQFSYTRIPLVCSDPGVPTNGNRDNNSNFTSGQTVRFTCKTGYQLWGPANITCQANLTWSGATPTCEAYIRLVDGSNPNEGRVEVRPPDSLDWGTVCHDLFDIKDADVVCKMLGYSSARQVRNGAYFGSGSGPVYMDDVQCKGNENSLFNCSYSGWMTSNCNHDQDVGVVCEEPLILAADWEGVFQIDVNDKSKAAIAGLPGEAFTLDYDPITDFIYWTNEWSIRRVRREGSRVETVIGSEIRRE